jgi:hypothetical protein
MPECSRCGISYLDSEVHSCRVEPYGVVLDLPPSWSSRRSLVVFGLLFGVLWGIVPWATFGRLQSLESVPLALVAGAVTGVVMAFLIRNLLRGLRRLGFLAVALLTLPIGAFVYGSVLATIVSVVPEVLPGRAPAPGGHPLYAGFGAVLGLLIAWPLLIVLVPAAVWTTWQLRGLVETRN